MYDWPQWCSFVEAGEVFSNTNFCINSEVYPPWNQHSPWQLMVRRRLSFWEGLYSGAMLVLGRCIWTFEMKSAWFQGNPGIWKILGPPSQESYVTCVSRELPEIEIEVIKFDYRSRWWFQIIPTWGNDPIWLILFKWVETTNQRCVWNLHKFKLVELPAYHIGTS